MTEQTQTLLNRKIEELRSILAKSHQIFIDSADQKKDDMWLADMYLMFKDPLNNNQYLSIINPFVTMNMKLLSKAISHIHDNKYVETKHIKTAIEIIADTDSVSNIKKLTNEYLAYLCYVIKLKEYVTNTASNFDSLTSIIEKYKDGITFTLEFEPHELNLIENKKENSVTIELFSKKKLISTEKFNINVDPHSIFITTEPTSKIMLVSLLL